MEYTHLKITGAEGVEGILYGGDYTGLDVAGLDDQPTLTSSELKDRFDALVKRLIVPRFNALLDALSSNENIHMETMEVSTPANGSVTSVALAGAVVGAPVMCQAAFDIAGQEDRTPYPIGAVCLSNGTVTINWSESTGTSVTVPVTLIWRA